MNRVYCNCDGELCMLIIRTEININYYKLDNVKSRLKLKQSVDKRIRYTYIIIQLLPEKLLPTHTHARTHTRHTHARARARTHTHTRPIKITI